MQMNFLSWMAWTLLLTQNPVPTAAPASIDGIVVSFGTAEPIGKAEVELRKISPGPTLPTNLPANLSAAQAEILLRSLNTQGAPASTTTFTTSSDGRFAFRNVLPGEYRMYVTRSTGYIPGEYGQRSPVGTGIPFTVTAGQNISNVHLALTPTSSISGRILDGDGDPVAYARVIALRVGLQTIMGTTEYFPFLPASTTSPHVPLRIVRRYRTAQPHPAALERRRARMHRW
jgi:hypothetical protein